MEVGVKNEVVNGAPPLAQRPQKNQAVKNAPGGGAGGGAAMKNPNQNQKSQNDNEGAPAEKKARFNNQQGGSHGQGQKGNFAGGNKGFGNNRGRGNPNRGGNQNRGNFQNQHQNQNQNQNQNQQNNDSKAQPAESNAIQDQIAAAIDAVQQSQARGGNRGGGNRERNRGSGRGGQGANNSGLGGFGGGRGDDFFIAQRLRAISGPTHELPAVEIATEAKFSGRNRLYVGNLTNDITEAELREMFKPYGDISEIFANAEKNFAFLKVDYHANAEKAKRELDGSMRKGRNLRVRFAPNATILRVKNLTPYVTNELLYKCFEIFGPVERAGVVVDDRGKHTGEGVVEFAKKSSSNACMRLCSEKCFFLTASLRPCVVEPFEVNDDADGLSEKSVNKKTPEFHHERSVGPRFADIDTFEHEYGTRWKQLYELYKSKQEALKRELKMEEEKLEAQMEYARYEHETELLRQELRKRESDNERKKMEWEMREKQAEDMKKREEESMRRQQSEMQSRMLRQEEEMRRRQQENTLFMQAQQLNSLLDQQEGSQGTGGPFGAGISGNFDGFGSGRISPFDFRETLSAFTGNNMGGNNNSGNSGTSNPQDQFPFDFGGNNQNQGGQGNQRGNNNSGGGKGNNNNNPWERRRRF